MAMYQLGFTNLRRYKDYRAEMVGVVTYEQVMEVEDCYLSTWTFLRHLSQHDEREVNDKLNRINAIAEVFGDYDRDSIELLRFEVDGDVYVVYFEDVASYYDELTGDYSIRLLEYLDELTDKHIGSWVKK